jgi:hypothetical protein
MTWGEYTPPPDMEMLLIDAAESGDLTRVQAISIAEWQSHRQMTLYQLAEACAGGHLRVVQWMRQTFGLTSEDAQKNDNSALRCACANSHLHVARWLHATFGLTVTDARAYDNCALRWACADGRLRMAQWLHQTFSLTVEDARADNNFALRCACVNGHHYVVQWLRITYGIAKPDSPLPWSREAHGKWYWQPHVVVLADRLPHDMLLDVLCAMNVF